MDVEVKDGARRRAKGTLLSKLGEPQSGSRMKARRPKRVLSEALEKKYEGMFVAVALGPRTKVVAAAKTYGALLDTLGRGANTAVSIVSVPRQGVLHSH